MNTIMEITNKISAARKLLLLPALFLSLTASAQSSKAIGEAFANTVRHYSVTETDSLAKVLVKKYGNQPEVLAQLGNAYFRNRELDQAKDMLELAIKKNPKAAAPLIQYGDIYKYYWNQPNSLDTAYIYYKKAIDVEPQSNVPYERIADLYMFKYKLYGNRQTHEDSLRMRHAADSAITVLKDLKARRPEYPAELELGGIYNRLGHFRESAEAYSKVVNRLEDYQYNNYALDYYFIGDFAKGLEVVNDGQKKFPDYPLFNRTRMYCLFGLEQYDDALVSYDKLLQVTDTLNSFDHFYAGQIYLKRGDVSTATETFYKIYDTHSEFANDHLKAARSLINKHITGTKSGGNYLQAAGKYADYIAAKRNRSGYDYYQMANIYREMIDDTLCTEAQRNMAIAKADSVYAIIQRDYPDYEATLMCYLRARMAAATDRAAAVPHYLRLIEVVQDPTTGAQTSEQRKKIFLSDAYRFLAVYNLHNDNTKEAVRYAKMYKSVNPDDNSLKPILDLDKGTGRRGRRR